MCGSNAHATSHWFADIYIYLYGVPAVDLSLSTCIVRVWVCERERVRRCQRLARVFAKRDNPNMYPATRNDGFERTKYVFIHIEYNRRWF